MEQYLLIWRLGLGYGDGMSKLGLVQVGEDCVNSYVINKLFMKKMLGEIQASYLKRSNAVQHKITYTNVFTDEWITKQCMLLLETYVR